MRCPSIASSFPGLSFAALTLCVVGCGKVPENPPPSCSASVCTVEEGDYLRTVVDAGDREQWVYVDLETGEAVTPDDPEHDPVWDLRFRRMVIATNGGVTGSGGVEVAILDDTTLDEVTIAPADGWQADVKGDGSDRDPGGTVFNEDPWYSYDLLTHTLDPVEDRVYVVRTGEGSFFKLRIDAYYNGDAAAGWPSFTWGAIPGL